VRPEFFAAIALPEPLAGQHGGYSPLGAKAWDDRLHFSASNSPGENC
jgi:hypothetical protein